MIQTYGFDNVQKNKINVWWDIINERGKLGCR